MYLSAVFPGVYLCHILYSEIIILKIFDLRLVLGCEEKGCGIVEFHMCVEQEKQV